MTNDELWAISDTLIAVLFALVMILFGAGWL